jgi:hypothetical protein
VRFGRVRNRLVIHIVVEPQHQMDAGCEACHFHAGQFLRQRSKKPIAASRYATRVVRI